jgi:hypothetical protein
MLQKDERVQNLPAAVSRIERGSRIVFNAREKHEIDQ